MPQGKWTVAGCLCLVLLASSSFSFAATRKPLTGKASDADHRAFLEACSGAFRNSLQGNTASGPSQGDSSESAEDAQAASELASVICSCTTKESVSQGVPAKTLRTETQKIKADPKYKIADPSLRASLQYCAIQIFHNKVH